MGALVPPEVDTVTTTVPEPPGVVKLKLVDEDTVAGTEIPPIVTVVLPATKLVPATDTRVPPPIGPDEGFKEVAVGTFS
jgi:hypothetical protein